MSVEGRGGGGGGSSHRASVLEKKLNIVVDDGDLGWSCFEGKKDLRYNNTCKALFFGRVWKQQKQKMKIVKENLYLIYSAPHTTHLAPSLNHDSQFKVSSGIY